MAITVADNRDQNRYEIRLDGELAGYSKYLARPGLIAFVHTEIKDGFKHRGLGARLVSDALNDARRRGLTVLPFCPFVQAFIQAHRVYASLVPQERWEAFGLSVDTTPPDADRA
jgi:predicted GNAT family acetyltransferase